MLLSPVEENAVDFNAGAEEKINNVDNTGQRPSDDATGSFVGMDVDADDEGEDEEAGSASPHSGHRATALEIEGRHRFREEEVQLLQTVSGPDPPRRSFLLSHNCLLCHALHPKFYYFWTLHGYTELPQKYQN